jgi:hypothetical protein
MSEEETSDSFFDAEKNAMLNDIKKLFAQKSPQSELSEKNVVRVLSFVNEQVNQNLSEISLLSIQNATNLKLEEISRILLYLIANKRVTGFINDKTTDDIADDVLIIRKQRIIDTLVDDED